MARKRNKPVATGTSRIGTPHSVYLTDEVSEAIERFIKSQTFKVTKTSVFEQALRGFLTEQGFWPPESEPQKGVERRSRMRSTA